MDHSTRLLQEFQYLDRVQGRAFEELIAAGDELDVTAVGLADVPAKASHKHVVFAESIDGHREVSGIGNAIAADEKPDAMAPSTSPNAGTALTANDTAGPPAGGLGIAD